MTLSAGSNISMAMDLPNLSSNEAYIKHKMKVWHILVGPHPHNHEVLGKVIIC